MLAAVPGGRCCPVGCTPNPATRPLPRRRVPDGAGPSPLACLLLLHSRCLLLLHRRSAQTTSGLPLPVPGKFVPTSLLCLPLQPGSFVLAPLACPLLVYDRTAPASVVHLLPQICPVNRAPPPMILGVCSRLGLSSRRPMILEASRLLLRPRHRFQLRRHQLQCSRRCTSLLGCNCLTPGLNLHLALGSSHQLTSDHSSCLVLSPGHFLMFAAASCLVLEPGGHLLSRSRPCNRRVPSRGRCLLQRPNSWTLLSTYRPQLLAASRRYALGVSSRQLLGRYSRH